MDITQATTMPAMTKAAHAQKVSQDFESFFVFQVLELMSPKPGEDSLLSGSFGEQVFRHQLNDVMAGEIIERGGIGLADQIYSQMLAYQEQGGVK